MCLQIEEGIVEHIQVEVRSANNSIYMYVFYFYLFQIYYFGLSSSSSKSLFIHGESSVKLKFKN